MLKVSNSLSEVQVQNPPVARAEFMLRALPRLDKAENNERGTSESGEIVMRFLCLPFGFS